MNRKGIAPLFATVVLVTIAVALGILVMNFGRAQIEISSRCALDIGLNFLQLGGEDQICVNPDTDQLQFTIENGAVIPVTKLKVRVLGDKDVFTDVLDAPLEIDGIFDGKLMYDIEQYGIVRQVKISPTIRLYNEEVLCPERALVVENVRRCP